MLNTAKTKRVVCIYDPAIDIKRIPPVVMSKYNRSRDIKVVEPYFISGSKPVIFNLKRISRSVMQRKIIPISSENERYIQCFQHSVESIENLPNDEGGTYLYMPEGVTESPAGDVSYVSEMELDRMDPCDVLEIGTVAWVMSFLRRNMPFVCPLVPMSVAILIDQEAHYVQQSQMDVHQNNSKPPGEERSQQLEQTAVTPGQDVSNSGKPMDVTAAVPG